MEENEIAVDVELNTSDVDAGKLQGIMDVMTRAFESGRRPESCTFFDEPRSMRYLVDGAMVRISMKHGPKVEDEKEREKRTREFLWQVCCVAEGVARDAVKKGAEAFLIPFSDAKRLRYGVVAGWQTESSTYTASVTTTLTGRVDVEEETVDEETDAVPVGDYEWAESVACEAMNDAVRDGDLSAFARILEAASSPDFRWGMTKTEDGGDVIVAGDGSGIWAVTVSDGEHLLRRDDLPPVTGRRKLPVPKDYPRGAFPITMEMRREAGTTVPNAAVVENGGIGANPATRKGPFTVDGRDVTDGRGEFVLKDGRTP